MAKRRKRAKSKACHKAVIRFKKKRGGIVSFTGKTGAGCGPRPKPKTGHLQVFKALFKTAARTCKKSSRARKTKHGVSAFNRCIGSKVRAGAK